MPEGRRTVTLLILALCLIYVAARLWRLTDSCLWFDEIFSVHAAEHSWNSLFWFVAQDLIHPPLFYALLKFWIGLGGESILWLRLLPVSFSVLALFPFIRLCRELKLDMSITLLSVGLLAVNGALIKYTQTLRMYSMLMCISLLSMWLFARYFNRGKSFVPLVIANVLLVYTHYFGWLVIGTEIAAILIFQRIKWRRAVTMFGIVAASFLPWFIAVWQAARQGSDLAQNIAWQARPGIREVFTFATDLIEPFYFQASSAEPASLYVLSIPLLFLGLAVLSVYFVGSKEEEEQQAVYLLVLLVALPLVIAFAASWLLPHSVWGTRHLIIVVPPAIILLAKAMLSLPSKPFRIVIVSLVIALSCVALVLNIRRATPRHVWCAWNDAAQDIKVKNTAGDQPTTIYALENLVAYHLWFALRDTDRFRVVVVKGIDVHTDDESYFLPRGFPDVQSTDVHDIADERGWLAFRTANNGEEASIFEPFLRLGYAACPRTQARFGPTTVSWMELRKDNCR